MMSISRISTEPDRQANGNGDDSDQQRVAGAVDHTRELVAPLLVDAEPVLGRRPRAAGPLQAREVARAWILGRDHRCEDGDEHEEPDQPEADERARVPPQPVPRVAPEAGGRLELDFSGFGFGDGHVSSPGSAG
jgi:hypothetical protein